MKGGKILKVAPLIHTRTYSCDFNSEFMVRPDCFLDSDIKWARKYILNATGEIDNVQGERWVIVDNGKYKIAGVVGFLKNICEKCTLSEDEYTKSETLFCDEKGRLVYAFIGVVIEKNRSYGKITCDYLWRKYLEYIFPIWKRTYQEVILRGFTDEQFESCDSGYYENAEECGGQKLYESNPSLDYKRFEYFLGSNTSDGFSYCSNICDYNLVKQSDFSIICTSRNVITRLKRISPQVVEIAPTTVSDTQGPLTPANVKQESENSKKKSFVALTICLLIFVIIILILLLLTGNSSQAGQLVLTAINCKGVLVLQEVVMIIS